MKFDWDNWNTGGRIIFVAACVAILSMFMNWVDIGITTRIGISQEAFLLLGFWIYPVVMLFKNKPSSLVWGVVCAALSFVFTAYYIATKSVEIFGETIDASAVGAWIFLFASAALGVGVVKDNLVRFSSAEIKTLLRTPCTAFAVLFGILGLFLLGHWFFSPDQETSDLEPITGLIFTVIAVTLWKLFGVSEDPGFGTDAFVSNNDNYDAPRDTERPDHLSLPDTKQKKKLKKVSTYVVAITSILFGGIVVLGVYIAVYGNYDYCVSQIEYSDAYLSCEEVKGYSDKYLSCIEEKGRGACSDQFEFSDEYSSCLNKIDDGDKSFSNVDASWLNTERTEDGGYRIPFAATDGLGNKVTQVALCGSAGRLLEITD